MSSKTEIEREEEALGNWPRRLLYVPTMTSYEWQPGNVYGSWAAPMYNAITYTWGRWRLDEDESPEIRPIDIRGVPWDIPRVKAKCFTPEDLLRVLKQAIEPVEIIDSVLQYSGLPDVEFVWLDIACIDQREDEPRSAAEVGRQFAIFKGAKWTFAWLHTLPLESLNTWLCVIDTVFTRDIYEHIQSAVDPSNLLIPSDVVKEFFTSATLVRVRDSLAGIFEDPWFTSLWTLQEAFLRQDAVMVSREGVAATLPDISPRSAVYHATLGALTSVGQALTDEEMRRMSIPDPYDQCVRMLEESGVAGLSTLHPLAVYAATAHRTTMKDEDRIYGIQQIFQLRLGTSSSQSLGSHMSREELEIQLGEQLLRYHPIMSQSHVFTKPAPRGRGWVVNPSSMVPSDMLGRSENGLWSPGADSARCELSVRMLGEDGAWGHFVGSICLFSTLNAACVEYEQNRPSVLHRPAEENYLSVYTDMIPELSGSPEFRTDGGYEWQRQLAHWLSQTYAESLYVLLLGTQTQNTSWDDTGINRFDEHMVGLLLLARDDGGFCYYRRIGLCRWDIREIRGKGIPQSSVLTGAGNEWVANNGLFG